MAGKPKRAKQSDDNDDGDYDMKDRSVSGEARPSSALQLPHHFLCSLHGSLSNLF